MTENTQELQTLTTQLVEPAGKLGLRISKEKCNVMMVGNATNQPALQANGQQLEEVENFCYLGSIISRTGDVEADKWTVELERQLQFFEE